MLNCAFAWYREKLRRTDGAQVNFGRLTKFKQALDNKVIWTTTVLDIGNTAMNRLCFTKKGMPAAHDAVVFLCSFVGLNSSATKADLQVKDIIKVLLANTQDQVQMSQSRVTSSTWYTA